MGREVKRVRPDFDWPLEQTWAGYLNPYYEHRKESRAWRHLAKKWRKTEPPKGDGWQMWETTSEGSPISPVCESPEALARWLADNNASAFGRMGATYEEWLGMIRGPG